MILPANFFLAWVCQTGRLASARKYQATMTLGVDIARSRVISFLVYDRFSAINVTPAFFYDFSLSPQMVDLWLTYGERGLASGTYYLPF